VKANKRVVYNSKSRNCLSCSFFPPFFKSLLERVGFFVPGQDYRLQLSSKNYRKKGVKALDKIIGVSYTYFTCVEDSMDSEFLTVASQKNPKITVRVMTGHFATSSAHRSQYIDLFELMSSASAARDAARELVVPYRTNTPVDAIVYMDNTEILAAFMADELLQAGMSLNAGNEILLLSPMVDSGGHFVFHQSVQEKIKNKNVVLVVALLSTGATVSRIEECLAYYGCNLVGISAIVCVSDVEGKVVHSLFDASDVPDFHFYELADCKMCQAGMKIDAIIGKEGYTKL
jgi:orotate phosphoribosyltransferase